MSRCATQENAQILRRRALVGHVINISSVGGLVGQLFNEICRDAEFAGVSDPGIATVVGTAADLFVVSIYCRTDVAFPRKIAAGTSAGVFNGAFWQR